MELLKSHKAVLMELFCSCFGNLKKVKMQVLCGGLLVSSQVKKDLKWQKGVEIKGRGS